MCNTTSSFLTNLFRQSFKFKKYDFFMDVLILSKEQFDMKDFIKDFLGFITQWQKKENDEAIFLMDQKKILQLLNELTLGEKNIKQYDDIISGNKSIILQKLLTVSFSQNPDNIWLQYQNDNKNALKKLFPFNIKI